MERYNRADKARYKCNMASDKRIPITHHRSDNIATSHYNDMGSDYKLLANNPKQDSKPPTLFIY